MAQTVPHSTNTEYERIFHPKKMAIIGISSKGTGAASDLFFSLKLFGYPGEIFLVNPKGGTLAGQEIHQSVQQIPGNLDLAAIFAGAAAVPDILEACRLKGAAVAEIFSAGFTETASDEGIALQKEIVRISQRGIRVVGPNCMGIYCPQGGLTIVQGQDFSRESGPVAFLSQSGGQAIDFTNLGLSIGLTFSKVVSFGNGADLRETELLRHLGEDPQTRIINMYIEGLADGDAFFNTIKDVARKKPVIVLKGGLSEAGSRAVLSHTASMGGSRKIWGSILKQVNAVQVRNVPEMARASLAFTHLPAKTYRNLSIVAGGGGNGVSGADQAETFGMKVPPFAPELSRRIDAFLPKPGSSAVNPVDLAMPFVPPQVIRDALSLAASDERIDLQILITMFSYYKILADTSGRSIKEMVPYIEIAESVREVAEKTGKPVVVILSNQRCGQNDLGVIELIEAARCAFIERGIVPFDDLSDALQAIAYVNDYYGGNEDE